MPTTETGREAEAAAAQYMESQGYRILERNWRTRFCEIDLVAQKEGALSFVEVKYRRSHDAGAGFEYITPAKLQRMRRAAEAWVQRRSWSGDYGLGAIQVTGDLKAPVIDFIDGDLL